MENKNYSKKGLEYIKAKDQQIAFQGIFKAVMQQEKDALKAEDLTYAILGRLNKRFAYPEEDVLEEKAEKYFKPQLKSMNEPKQEVCPKCRKGRLVYREGIKNGKKWRGQFCNNSECKHVVWMPHRDPEAKDYNEDSLLDEVSHLPTVNDDEY